MEDMTQMNGGERSSRTKQMKTALTIAGSDSSGGAGIQADLKTMTMHGVFGMSAITALTAQNTVGVQEVMEVTPGFLARQIDCVFTDIRPDAVKIGMLPSPELIRVTADRLHEYGAEHIVVDPVMVATSGSRLMQEESVQVMKEVLFPLAAVITPNLPEAEVLWGHPIVTGQDMVRAAEAIGRSCGTSVLIKGGHQRNEANDYLWQEEGGQWFRGKRIENPNTHGTGCTLSSAVASNLAMGYSLPEAVERAKDYLSGALAAMLDLGKGSGPMNHSFRLQPEEGAAGADRKIIQKEEKGI